MRHLTHQLMHLVVIIDKGSLSAAAEDLNLTQPALSRSIRYLEQEFQGKLLNRGREGATPTRLGQQLYIHGKNILASLDRAAADVQAWHQHDRGHLILGSTALPAVYFVPEAIASFLADRPDVGMRYEVHHLTVLETMLRQGALDLFVGALSIENPSKGVQTTLLRDDSLSIICGPDHPLAQHNTWRNSELAKYPWILPTKDTALRQQAETAFAEFGLKNVEIAVETVATTTLIPFMSKGDYLSLHSKYLLSNEIESGKLVALPKQVPNSRRSLNAFHRPDEETPELVRTFIQHMKDFANPS